MMSDTSNPGRQETFAPNSRQSNRLRDECIALVGRFGGMTQRDAKQLIRNHGGSIFEKRPLDESVTLIVIGDAGEPLERHLEQNDLFDLPTRNRIASGAVPVIRESELWQRVGLIDEEKEAKRLYTPAMLAGFVGVPVSAIRRWHRRGILHAVRQVRRLAYFDFTEVTVALRLAKLFAAGCSLHAIERKLDELARQMPAIERPLAALPFVVEGKRLLIRRGDELTEPGGQLLLDFETTETGTAEATGLQDGVPQAISIEEARSRVLTVPSDGEFLLSGERLLATAAELEQGGELTAAAEMYRAALAASGPSAELHFLLADVLYRLGDLPAARERYYAAIEMDEWFVEARANLGCVLAEMGSPELAIAAFEGTLAIEPAFPDVHYHLARTLDALGRSGEAEMHWRAFIQCSPAGPWADEAAERLG
ncbi:MAG: tetratricopeptide repeat protein [Pirellulales bacterium]|nr:tetratricopeptide repeat protein [Pirellulales bacterium]